MAKKQAAKLTTKTRAKRCKLVPESESNKKLTNNEIAIHSCVGKDQFVIFDLDGCISNDAWRFDFVQEREIPDERYSLYHAALNLDEPLEEGAKLLRKTLDMDWFPVFITARPESVREKTCEWLGHHFALMPNVNCALLMRANGDPTPTVEIKRELVEQFSREILLENVLAAYDDRADIVTMYHSAFDINAFVLDKDGVRDILNLHQRRAGINAPGHSDEPKQRESEAVGGGPYIGQHIGAKTKKDYNDVPEILHDMADTFKYRNERYGNNAIKVGDVMAVLFPNGVTVRSAADHRTNHLFNLLIVKLTRFVNSGMKHQDSIHDLALYAGMVESELEHHSIDYTP